MVAKWFMRSSLILAATLATGSVATAQQTGVLRGTITYGHNGEGVPGIRVMLPEARFLTTTDEQGRFRIERVLAGEHDLTLDLFGCELAARTVTVVAGEERTMDFAIGPPVINLEGLVVTGLAAGMPEAELPFTVERLDAEELPVGQARSIADLIRGRIPGAKIIQGSGQPGAEFSIQFRGPTSLQRLQEPLIVVDGIPFRGGLSTIHPMDVDRIEVLKGATASAVYGSRAQAGVIEITTKRGLAGNPPPEGPLLVIDGQITEETLASVDPATISDIRMLQGAAGAVLYGAQGESGVIQVTTKEWALANDAAVWLPRCESVVSR